VCDQSSLEGLCVQDYKPLSAAATIFVPPGFTRRHTDKQTDTQTDNIVTGLGLYE